MKTKILASAFALMLSSPGLQADVTQPLPQPPTTPPTTGGGDTFGALVQQNTSQAAAIFQGVDFKTLYNNQDQNYFFSSDDSDDSGSGNDLNTLVQKFQLAPEN